MLSRVQQFFSWKCRWLLASTGRSAHISVHFVLKLKMVFFFDSSSAVNRLIELLWCAYNTKRKIIIDIGTYIIQLKFLIGILFNSFISVLSLFSEGLAIDIIAINTTILSLFLFICFWICIFLYFWREERIGRFNFLNWYLTLFLDLVIVPEDSGL